MILRTIDGHEIKLRCGDRICSIKHPDLMGHIDAIEMHQSGVPSAIPYRLRWDDEQRATQVLGILGSIYGSDSAVRIAS